MDVRPKGYQSSGLKTASGVIKDSSGRAGNIQLITSASNIAVTVILYDHSSTASGTEIGRAQLSSTSLDDFVNVPLPDLVFAIGCYAEMTNGSYVVHFS